MHSALLRRLLASGLATASVVPLYHEASGHSFLPVVGLLGMGAPLLAGALIYVRRLEAQLLARAILWATLVFGTLLAWVVDGPEVPPPLLVLPFGAGLALIALGALGLEDPPLSPSFAPVALRGVVLGVLGMALADTLSLLFWGGLITEEGMRDPIAGAFFLGGGALMLTAVYGLYRVRVWGFVLNVVANLGIAAGAWMVPNMPTPLAICLTSTAVGQLLLGLPLMRGLARGQTMQLSPVLARRLGGLVIAGLLASVAVARWIYVMDPSFRLH